MLKNVEKRKLQAHTYKPLIIKMHEQTVALYGLTLFKLGR